MQNILNWSYSPAPQPELAFPNGFSTASPQVTLNGGATLNGTRLRLTDGNLLEARSAFFTEPGKCPAVHNQL